MEPKELGFTPYDGSTVKLAALHHEMGIPPPTVPAPSEWNSQQLVARAKHMSTWVRTNKGKMLDALLTAVDNVTLLIRLLMLGGAPRPDV
jgi:hypothetical protein